jgi:outer membrane lipoprotein-sorting protein
MQLRSNHAFLGATAAALVWLTSVVAAGGQAAADRPLMSEDVFKNVQVLKGITVNEFMGTMGIFSAALGMSCEDCHAADDSNWANYATDSPKKRMARAMVTMMAGINKANFGGRQMVTCFTCHRGSDRPRTTPNLTTLYGAPPPDDSSDVFAQAKLAPAADEVLDKYIQAIGGAPKLAALTSFVAKGTSVGYGPEGEKRPVEIYARAPGQRTTIIHTASGDSTTAVDGRTAWIAAPHRPVAVLGVTGQELEGLQFDAALSFPGRIKESLTKWRVGSATTINDRDVHVVQGQSGGGAVVSLYFDAETGLLLRQQRFADSPVGRIPVLVDYADYRDVAGVKMPFRWTVIWLDGKDTFELTDIQANARVDASRFAKPAAPVVPR